MGRSTCILSVPNLSLLYVPMCLPLPGKEGRNDPINLLAATNLKPETFETRNCPPPCPSVPPVLCGSPSKIFLLTTSYSSQKTVSPYHCLGNPHMEGVSLTAWFMRLNTTACRRSCLPAVGTGRNPSFNIYHSTLNIIQPAFPYLFILRTSLQRRSITLLRGKEPRKGGTAA